MINAQQPMVSWQRNSFKLGGLIGVRLWLFFEWPESQLLVPLPSTDRHGKGLVDKQEARGLISAGNMSSTCDRRLRSVEAYVCQWRKLSLALPNSVSEITSKFNSPPSHLTYFGLTTNDRLSEMVVKVKFYSILYSVHTCAMFMLLGFHEVQQCSINSLFCTVVHRL